MQRRKRSLVFVEMINRDDQIQTLEKEINGMRQQNENHEVETFTLYREREICVLSLLERINYIDMKPKSIPTKRLSMNWKIKLQNIKFKSMISQK